MRRLALLSAVSLVLAAAPAFADTPRLGGRVSYRPPVAGPVVDPFRVPAERWSAGNRGIDYTPGAGTSVVSSADGEVVFAGQVGGDLHVVVLHADGIRTTYAFLQSIGVHRGDKVRQGQPVGTSGEQFHFGARVGDTYIDPRTLFDEDEPEVFLVPEEVRRAGSEAEERSGLARFLGALGRAGRFVAEHGNDAGEVVAGWGRYVAEESAEAARNAVTSYVEGQLEQARLAWHYVSEATGIPLVVRLARTAGDYMAQRDDCTPASVQPPPVPERRVAVLVGGIGASDKDSLVDLDTDALGYAPEDVLRFSYKGGTVEENAYRSGDTTVDIRDSAARLRDLLERVHREHPGVPVDLIGHSQGGIVARRMLAYEYDDEDTEVPRIANLVTLASPHGGADIATALALTGTTWVGETVQWTASATGLSPHDLQGESLRQLSEASPFLADLNNRSLPEGVKVTSIGARGDWTVPAVRTRLPGASNVVVSVPGGGFDLLKDHGLLPGSAVGQREVALAVAGLPPTCQTFENMLADTVVSDRIAWFEDTAGAAAWFGASKAGARVEEALKPPKMPPIPERRDP